MKEEFWVDIPNYEGVYQISNLGSMRSYSRVVDYGVKKAYRPGKVLKLRKSNQGYLYTVFCLNKIRETIKPHRIVAKVFLENKENKPCVNYINGIKHDNTVENLEWVTYSENTIHSFKLNLSKSKKGEESHLSKLKNSDVLNIRNMCSNKKISQLDVAKKYNISQSQVSRIMRNTNWTLI
jgi:hypothetical protein